MIYSPIYKDTYYTSSANSLTYLIKLEGKVIYSGKAFKKPDADYININVNKICRNYLSSDIADLITGSSTYITDYNAIKTFDFCDSAGTVLQQYMFLFDYDYSDTWGGGAKNLSLPINGHYATGMLKPQSNVTASNNVRIYKSTGSYPTLVKCNEYAIYYLNAKGGWDAFLFEGKCIKKDQITQYTTDKTFNNTTIEFENNRYVSEIKTSYELSTGLLSDGQSENFAKNLIGSNKCYLHNLKTGEIKPVVITDNSVTYQTYQNNNKKFAVYKLQVSDSQMKIRK